MIYQQLTPFANELLTRQYIEQIISSSFTFVYLFNLFLILLTHCFSVPYCFFCLIHITSAFVVFSLSGFIFFSLSISLILVLFSTIAYQTCNIMFISVFIVLLFLQSYCFDLMRSSVVILLLLSPPLILSSRLRFSTKLSEFFFVFFVFYFCHWHLILYVLFFRIFNLLLLFLLLLLQWSNNVIYIKIFINNLQFYL